MADLRAGLESLLCETGQPSYSDLNPFVLQWITRPSTHAESFLLIPPLHRGCDLSASIVRPQNWPGRRWRQKGGRMVALVAQWWYTGRSDVAMDAMVAEKFWACSKQSHKGLRGGRSLTGRSKEAGGRHTHRHGGRMDAQWSAIGRPVKNTYCCEHCVSIWATLLPSLYHHCASFGRLIASIERSQWRPLCLHSATTATLQPPWQWFCLHSASFAWPVAPLQQIWSFKEGTRVVLQQLHRNRTFWVWATTERPGHFSGRSKVARRLQPCVKGALLMKVYYQSIVTDKKSLLKSYKCNIYFISKWKHQKCWKQKPFSVCSWFQTLTPGWINNHMPSKVWDEITYSFPNCNGSTIVDQAWICTSSHSL